ncbi:shikimate dehydrogenase [Buchnera aphidicola str. APS (Acyrthosiphon pisum)]|uniref:Shikimate dehydrogenase (NADP(+)) n=3 Tax=Buchnera aphidicola TaxID=9 RepID=AROE_BUCAI|nr:shikimate dehydrogenase [Buchnera aphidicola]B8D818.1 RecName: Full=Shikimate dehydrogenase (NADP(+)); Short=SDH [Buchnera aphidicola str. Tuc7 (Acyrthosiphon pisum)]B8D9R6.1 RecName: Full=Shikimate dehydrogenase (NADP(+)); Short=SDH [Buchnera aphidicola str. 5A (Acyrthosiphon pisum)]Q44607.3 RecName: Full=Shikimate dehydrogenase (NADP(+)); Short=SDH [Buchnera aphidicola str. APS (Acyrthosiphon pisum)]pir/B84987/ shikimate 5-dehydrogenase (EC 1.1.1.25) [imported] - Buchnera sp. (strain APS) 
MFKCKNFNYAVFGNPINHSKSPEIHSLFSKQTGISHFYKSCNVPLNSLYAVLQDFFKKDGRGANITAPFKQEAYFFCNKLTKRAEVAQSVNTLKKIDNCNILGDNTDGIGLLSDLIRLNFIKKNYSILIIGAGGAARGVLFPLLSYGCSICIFNRTVLNAEKLVLQFHKYGNINVFNTNSLHVKSFDLIINATSHFIQDKDNFIPFSCVSSKTCFYDMNYQTDNTFFFDWSRKTGSNFFSNGIGMLVFQAAHSFFLWHNVLPEIDYIIDLLNK